jgi:adiponectin receptor
MTFYLSFISIFALTVLLFSFKSDFGEPSKRGLRGFLFLTLGLSTALPMIHLVFFSSTISENITSPSMLNWLFGGLSYVGGCLIYINRFPEKNWPGRFCIWGSSHQIWHLMVFMGIVFHFFGSLDSYYDRMTHYKNC